jgi:glycerol uptake facilitator-like aquaporin
VIYDNQYGWQAARGVGEVNSEGQTSLKSFLVELVIYATLVIAYFFLVLHFLGDWLKWLHDNHTKSYAAVALVLIVLQGMALEAFTTALLRFIRSKLE